MSSHCCDEKGGELAALRRTHGRVLIAVLAINAIMFAVELAAGISARSSALLADSLDMFGDAAVYGFSLFVLWRSERWKARAAVLKGALMAVFGAGVLAETVRHALSGTEPTGAVMGAVGALALAANTACLLLLLRHRNADLNMKSTWLCSRNDVVANLAVLGAAAAVVLTGSRWPDLAVGAAIASLFLHSAVGVLRDAARSLRALRAAGAASA